MHTTAIHFESTNCRNGAPHTSAHLAVVVSHHVRGILTLTHLHELVQPVVLRAKDGAAGVEKPNRPVVRLLRLAEGIVDVTRHVSRIGGDDGPHPVPVLLSVARTSVGSVASVGTIAKGGGGESPVEGVIEARLELGQNERHRKGGCGDKHEADKTNSNGMKRLTNERTCALSHKGGFVHAHAHTLRIGFAMHTMHTNRTRAMRCKYARD